MACNILYSEIISSHDGVGGHAHLATIRWGGFRRCVCLFCSDLRPLHLLRYLVPDRNRLPPGVEIAYDQHANVHAFRFVPPNHTDRFSFAAARLLRQHGTRTSCHFFPEEFSLLITFKMSSKRKLKSAEIAQCLFAISRRGMNDNLHS